MNTPDISFYFKPIAPHLQEQLEFLSPNHLGKAIQVFTSEGNFPDWKDKKLAIIGVKEDRNALLNNGCAQSPDKIREHLYALYKPGNYCDKMVDLGNIEAGHSFNDTYFAVSAAISGLIKKGITVIVIGGSQDLTYAIYKAYESLEQTVNIVVADRMLDLGNPEGVTDSQSYLSKIVLHQPSYLFNYSNIGYQSYFVDKEELDLMEKLYFDVHRLGAIQKNLEVAEPVIRNADIISFDASCIRMSDAPGTAYSTPNGFYGEEICQLARYAGFSDKISTIGFFEVNPIKDSNNQTSFLFAEAIWYFVEGFGNRKEDLPISGSEDYLKYRVGLSDSSHEIVFFKSKKTDRWWMSVPYPPDKKLQFERHHLVPCTYQDYLTATEDEMPDRWWQTYSKLC